MRVLIAGGVLVLATGGVGAGMYWSGGIAEQQYQQAWDELAESPSIRVVDRDFQRGQWRSTARTEFTVTGEVAELMEPWSADETRGELTFVMEDTVHHGPVLLGADRPFAAARIESNLRPGDVTVAAFPALARDRSLLEADTVVAFDGSSRIRYWSPDYDWQEGDGRFLLSGMHGTVKLNATLDEHRTESFVNELVLAGPEARFSIRDAAVRADGRAVTPRLWVGASELTVEHVAVEAEGERAELDGMIVSWTVDADDGVVSADLAAGLDVIRSPEGEFRDGRLRVAARNIDQDALERVIGWGEAVEQGRMSRNEFNRRLMSAWPEFLARNPELVVEELGLQTSDGPFSGSAGVLWTAGAPDINNPFALVNGLAIEVRLAGPRDWWQQAAEGLASEAPVDAADDMTLRSLIDQGLLVEDNGDLRTELILREGMVHANGNNLGSVWQLIMGF